VKILKIIFWLFLCWESTVLQAQTVSLPDTNLRNKLIASYPQVIQNNQLVLSEAAALIGALDLSRANISDVSGIEYFKNISTLILSENKLSSIPDISSITNLTNFYASNNNLVSLPDFSSFKKLTDFQVMNNKLTHLPNFATPSLLQSIYCSNNLLMEFPSLTQFPNLKNLVIGKNNFQNTFDFSTCVNLVQLHVHQLGIDKIVGLNKLKNLNTIYAWGNKIQDFSGLDSNTNLMYCIIFENPIKKLPNLKNKPNLKDLSIANCYLTFENFADLPSTIPTFNYFPQLNLSLPSVSAREGENVTFSYPIASALSNNIYVWKKDGKTLDSSSTKTYTILSSTKANAGLYKLIVYNPSYPLLTLKSNDFSLDIKPCVELTQTTLSFLDEDCSKGYTLDLSSIQVQGAFPPYSFTFENSVESKKYNDRQIIQLEAGKYNITIRDSKNCSFSHQQTLNKIENCDPVLTPNGDGVADSYFIDKKGIVKIYDQKRSLIKTLETPASWDGTNQAGTLMDAGYYILIPDGDNPIYITIIR